MHDVGARHDANELALANNWQPLDAMPMHQADCFLRSELIQIKAER